MSETIVIGSDHAGFPMKEFIKSELEKSGISFKDVGTFSTDSTDYPIYAGQVGREVGSGAFKRGIAICGAGIGASIAANRYKGVRAALCLTEEMAKLSREHNDSNVLVLGGRITSTQTASNILKLWLETPFEGGRHIRRITMLDKLEQNSSQTDKQE